MDRPPATPRVAPGRAVDVPDEGRVRSVVVDGRTSR